MNSSSTSFIQTLRVITLALVMGPTVFLGVVFFVVLYGAEPLEQPHEAMTFFLAIVLGSCAISNLITGPIVKKIKTSAASKQGAYQSSHIIRIALAEGPALFGGLGLMLFARGLTFAETPLLRLFLLPHLVLILTAAIHFPSPQKLQDFTKSEGR